MRRLILALSVLAVFSICQFGVASTKGVSTENKVPHSSVTEYVEYFYVGDQLYKITYHDDGSTTIEAIQCTQGD